MMNVYGAFAVVNKSLKTGKDVDGNSIDPIRQRCLPRDLSYQKYYISSASSTDTQFGDCIVTFLNSKSWEIQIIVFYI